MKLFGGRQVVRHASRESRVEMVVGADVAGHDDRAGAVAPRHPVRRRSQREHPVARKHHIGGDDFGRIEGDHDLAPAKGKGRNLVGNR